MKISFSTLGCPDWRFEDILSTAKDLGYHGVELRGVQNETYAPRIPQLRHEQLPKTLARLEALSLEIPCLTTASELFNPDGFADMLHETQEYIDLAQELKTPYIRVLGDREPAPGAPVDDGRVIGAAEQLGAYALKHGVTVLIESNGAYADSARLANVLASVSGGVGALWDVHHPFRFFGESARTTWQNLKPWLKHVHFKDSVVQDGRVRYRMMGNGDLPLDDFISELKGGGYDGHYSLEWVKRWDLTLEEPGIAFAAYIRFMRRREQNA